MEMHSSASSLLVAAGTRKSGAARNFGSLPHSGPEILQVSCGAVPVRTFLLPYWGLRGQQHQQGIKLGSLYLETVVQNHRDLPDGLEWIGLREQNTNVKEMIWRLLLLAAIKRLPTKTRKRYYTCLHVDSKGPKTMTPLQKCLLLSASRRRGAAIDHCRSPIFLLPTGRKRFESFFVTCCSKNRAPCVCSRVAS